MTLIQSHMQDISRHEICQSLREGFKDGESEMSLATSCTLLTSNWTELAYATQSAQDLQSVTQWYSRMLKAWDKRCLKKAKCTESMQVCQVHASGCAYHCRVSRSISILEHMLIWWYSESEIMLELEKAQSSFLTTVPNLDTPCQIPSMSSNGTSKAGVSLSIWLLISQMHKDMQRQECTASFMNSQGSTCPCSGMMGVAEFISTSPLQYRLQTEFKLLKPSCESFSLLVLYIDVVQLLQIQTQLMLYLSVIFSLPSGSETIAPDNSMHMDLRVCQWKQASSTTSCLGWPAIGECIEYMHIHITVRDQRPLVGIITRARFNTLYTPQPDLSWINLRPPYT